MLAGMVRSRQLLAGIEPHWTKEGLFHNRELDRLGSVCIAYFRKYDKPPRNLFPDLVLEKFQNSGTKIVDSVNTMLQELGNYPKRDADYLIDLAQDVFYTASWNVASKLVEDTKSKSGLLNNEIEIPTKLSLVPDEGIICGDEEAARLAFERTSEVLLTYNGDLGGVLMRGAFCRQGFVSFIAHEKGGKSYWLLDVAWRAQEQGRNVAYFSVGDMSIDEVQLRIFARAGRRPYVEKDNQGSYIYPQVKTKIATDVSDVGKVMFRKKTFGFEDYITWEYGVRRYQKRMDGKGVLRIVDKPSETCSVRDIESILARWRTQQDWKCDIVIIDYADILAPPAQTLKDDYRHRIDGTWKQMRKLSQDLDCCVVTATQATRFNRKEKGGLLLADSISEDKRKLAHVTAMFGINPSDYEEQKFEDSARINCLARRKGRNDPNQCVYVAGCLEFSDPAMVSCLAQ